MGAAGRSGLRAVVLVAALAAGPLASPTCARRLQSCLDRCEFEMLDHHRLLVVADDVLSFQRFFEPVAVGAALQDVTSLEVRCSQALLSETLQPFNPAWDALAPDLLHLELRRCRIMSLAPRALARLANLTSLVVDNQDEGGPFLASKGGLQGLTRLASFRLSHARLGSLDHTLFHQNVRHNLIKVFLTHNGLTHIEPHALCGMPRLSDLDLSCNKLDVTSLDFLQCTPSLYLLNLSRNALQSLPRASLTHSPTLHTLDLSHNNLSSTAALVAAFNATTSLRQVFLAGNPWRCNRTALLQLHGLRTARLQVADWHLLACRHGEERLLVQEWLFPHVGGGVRAWHVILGVMGVAGGLCCLLAVRGRVRRLPTFPWLWPRKVLPYDVGHLAPDSPPGKLPKPPTCVSVLAVPEEVVPPPKDAPLKGLVNGISEALIDKVLSELPRPVPRGEEESAPETSYVSYKSQLDPEERRPAGHHKRQQEQQALSAPGPPLLGDAGNSPAAASQGRDDEDVSDENLPLTTSAGP
ncbi:TLR4 interactor with leucine rich repeats [Portunus trituberculatus]|uniref:TLR4 interactor with leucine rich repeats n=1 Tax=Portunus trituberculatus TaxID=210409 RepID=A0A5B7DSI5_PORTR|nr:TLR4 interactor with leucine rich repeats [Portunus trituberculatus]